jgi:peptide/nickel transport system substrate-binding protein
MSRIDPKKGKVVKTISIPASPTCIRAGAGSIWVAAQNDDRIFRIAPATNAVTAIPIGHGSELCVDVHDDGVWVSDDTAGSVTRVDPATNKVVSTIKVGTAPSDGTRGPDGYEWIGNAGDGTISRIDPATDKVVDTIDIGGTPFVVRSFFGTVWAGDFKGTTIKRIRP